MSPREEDAADTEVDAQLGYPPAYATLCHHAHATGLPLMPFLEGPPQRFLPYAPLPDEFPQLKDWDTVFPVVAEKEKDSSGIRKFAEELWQQLDHLGNAGFDPAKFRVDPYGNVVYWNADPSSPLAWDVDYWFPHPRGGKATLPNLRIVQWQAYLRKRNRLEFLVPWWDLQHGCSINQFLSAFAAKNADFRKRSFALFFAGGEDESVAREHVGECRPWPQQFREKKALCGLAAAAIVTSAAKETPGADSDPAKSPVTSSDVSRILGSYSYGAILAGASSKHLWSAEEEEAMKRGMSKFGPGSWKEIKEDETALANRSVAQIKEKFRLMRGVSRSVTRENGRGGLSGRQSTATTALQKELRVKIMREEERREREEELTQLEATVARLKVENERERAKAAELEALLKKHKQRVEKQRKWAESQASYRLCLERVLRDTMHQTMTYKEQARLSREACNVLIARLDSQKAACEAMEQELLQRHSQREVLEAAAAGGGAAVATKLVTQGRDLVDVSSCISLLDDDEEEEENLVNEMSGISDEDDDDDDLDNLRIFRERQVARKSLVRHAIKVAMEIEDTKETVGDSQWDMPPKPPCPIQASRHTAPGHDGDSEMPVSESDSDFADDEMSPAIRVISRDDDADADKKLVSELSQFHDGPTSELREFCTRNSKPDDSCMSTIEDVYDAPGESSDQSKQLEVVQQKDVIMVQQKEEMDEEEDPGSCKQEYIDALLQQIRFQIPTSEAGAEPESGHAYISEGHLDELLEQVLKTQLESVQTPEIKEQQEPGGDMEDEKLKEIGKSNLDKWLHSLLFKETESVCSSPGHELPIPAPALSQLSRELLILHRSSENADQRPRSGLWGALLRKLSVKHHEEDVSVKHHKEEVSVKHHEEGESSSSSSTSENRLFEPGKEDYDMVDEAQNVQTAMNSLLKSSPSDNSSSTLAEGRSCLTLPGWPGGNPKMGAIASNYWPKDADDSRSMKRTDHGSRRPLSDVEEMSETGSFTESPKPERKELQVHRHKRRVSIKVAGFVGWKKSSAKRSSAESRLQPDPQEQVATYVMEP